MVKPILQLLILGTTSLTLCVSQLELKAQSLNGFQLLYKQPESKAISNNTIYKNVHKPAMSSAENGNPNGLFASLFFGTSQLKYKFNEADIAISQISFGRGNEDSIIPIPNGVSAVVNPGTSSQKLNLDAGLWLGYFPKFLHFQLAEEKSLSLGVMSKVGFSFNGGLGAWLGVGPELMYTQNQWSFNLGYLVGWTGTQKTLANLQLKGTDSIVIQSGIDPSLDNFKSESPLYRLHNEDSKFNIVASSSTSAIYARLGYTFSERTGVGIVLGYRNMKSLNTSYELKGPYKKTGSEERTPLKGPEMDNLSSSFGFNGLFFQIQLFEKPLW
jgi:hypothetical protein